MPSSQGVYTPAYSYTDAITGCSNTLTVSILVDNCTGLSKQASSSAKIQVYPNPNNGDFAIQTGNSNLKAVTVMDLTGRVVVSMNSADGTITVSLQAFAKEIYSVIINSNNETQVFRIVVE